MVIRFIRNYIFLIIPLIYLVLLTPTSTFSKTDSITPEQALTYVGQIKTVCGKVASSIYASSSNGSPTFLNLNKPYPNHIFTVVIWGSNRYKFDMSPESYYKWKNICVTGKIGTYKGTPQIEVVEPSQITFAKIEITQTAVTNSEYYKRYSSDEIKVFKTIFFLLGYDVNYQTANWSNKANNAVETFQKNNHIKQDGKICTAPNLSS